MFGQKMTHALRSEMSQKLTHLEASTLAGQNPGEIAARFSGDVDTVEALFTSGVISMAADVCRLISIFAVIAVKNTGLALLLLLVLPVLMTASSGLSIFMSTWQNSFLGQYLFFTPLMELFLHIAPYIITTLAFTGLYVSLPNTKVRFVLIMR